MSDTEQNDVLRGNYHSHYPPLSRAIFPDVDFVFVGTPDGSTLRCSWQGRGGARGRMTLKLLYAGALQIAWNATELGKGQWLVNGGATLTKR